ncbi:hypothetical protein KSP39_PZI003169 [Platanthera zijinensis]|uniref:Uncharacterized protein n=1 Tax=Platanthera zijinensis TaxID=2320716 RepID=A0AAP0BXP2_9ASPA
MKFSHRSIKLLSRFSPASLRPSSSPEAKEQGKKAHSLFRHGRRRRRRVNTQRRSFLLLWMLLQSHLLCLMELQGDIQKYQDQDWLKTQKYKVVLEEINKIEAYTQTRRNPAELIAISRKRSIEEFILLLFRCCCVFVLQACLLMSKHAYLESLFLYIWGS